MNSGMGSTATLALSMSVLLAAWQCNGVTVYDRDEWGARDPACQTPMSTPVVYTFIHHTVTAECSDFPSCSQKARDVQNFHMDGNGNSNSNSTLIYTAQLSSIPLFKCTLQYKHTCEKHIKHNT